MLGLAEFADVQGLAPGLLNFRQPQPVQAAAIETLARFDQPHVPGLLLEAWPSASPQLRASAVEAFFSKNAPEIPASVVLTRNLTFVTLLFVGWREYAIGP